MKVSTLIREKTQDNNMFFIKAEMMRYKGKLMYTKYVKFVDDITAETYSILSEGSGKYNVNCSKCSIRFKTFLENHSYVMKSNKFDIITEEEYNRNIPHETI